MSGFLPGGDANNRGVVLRRENASLRRIEVICNVV